jgi:hypothetical protein
MLGQAAVRSTQLLNAYNLLSGLKILTNIFLGGVTDDK